MNKTNIDLDLVGVNIMVVIWTVHLLKLTVIDKGRIKTTSCISGLTNVMLT